MVEISLCLIVKDEEKVLKRCIDSMKGCYDELIIVDTGSTDKTVKIAKSLGARVEHFKWIDDFSAARNYSFSFATKSWIMWVDADDILYEGDAIKFKQNVEQLIKSNPDMIGVNCPYIYSHESTGTGEIPNFKYHRLRIIKKDSGYWVGRIHEYIKIDNSKTINDDRINFHHFREENKGTMNTARNLRILKKVVNEASEEELPRYLFYYGKECMYNNLYDEAIKSFLKYIPLSNWIPEKHRAMYELAVCYDFQKDRPNAIKYALKAIEIDENYVDPYILLGRLAYNDKRWKDAIKWMTAATLTSPARVLFFDYIPFQTYVPYDYMSIAYWNLKQYSEGYKCILKCLQYRPNEERYLYNKKEFEKMLNIKV